ncbi:MAG: hypothetical protein GY754_36450 [bacterium]|nr:hypothetical protein [bacterium]
MKKHFSFKHLFSLFILAAAVSLSMGCDTPPAEDGTISAFGFYANQNSELQADLEGIVDQASHTITAEIPNGTDVASLTASFQSNGTVEINGAAQSSGSSVNDFSNSVVYTVTSSTGSVQDYTVTIVVTAAEWQGTQLLGTDMTDKGQGLAMDSNGNIYVSGYTKGNLNGNTNAGSWDVILVKYNKFGQMLWTRQVGAQGVDEGNAIAIDSKNNIYIAGNTLTSLDGSEKIGQGDIFLMKFNASGEKQWTRLYGTIQVDEAYDIGIDSDDNIFITGKTNGDLDGNAQQGHQDVFLMKLNTSGTKQWTQTLGSQNSDFGFGVAFDSANNIYVAGLTAGILAGNTTLDEPVLLAKFNQAGSVQWIKQSSINSHLDRALDVAVDSSDNVYITGYSVIYPEVGGAHRDIFIAKYNSSGVLIWTREMGSTNDLYSHRIDDEAHAITIDSNDNIYISGNTEGSLDANPLLGSYDFFLSKYTSDGEKLYTKQLGSVKNDYALDMITDSFGSVYLTGCTEGDMGEYTQAGVGDMFLMRENQAY